MQRLLRSVLYLLLHRGTGGSRSNCALLTVGRPSERLGTCRDTTKIIHTSMLLLIECACVRFAVLQVWPRVAVLASLERMLDIRRPRRRFAATIGAVCKHRFAEHGLILSFAARPLSIAMRSCSEVKRGRSPQSASQDTCGIINISCIANSDGINKGTYDSMHQNCKGCVWLCVPTWSCIQL